jgi:hypothetical protein
MANRTKLTRNAREKFLAALREVPNVSRAARLIGMSRRYMYEVREVDAEFAQEWDDAVEVGCDAIEEEAHRRAAKGTLKPVFYKGMPVGFYVEYSDTLMLAMLKAHRPEKYREHVDMNIDADVKLKGYAGWSPDEWDKPEDPKPEE